MEALCADMLLQGWLSTAQLQLSAASQAPDPWPHARLRAHSPQHRLDQRQRRAPHVRAGCGC